MKNVTRLDVLDIFAKAIVDAGFKCSSLEDAIRHSNEDGTLLAVMDKQGESLQIFIMETVADLHWADYQKSRTAGLQRDVSTSISWTYAVVKNEKLAAILDHDRIYKIGLQIVEEQRAEEARAAAEIQEAARREAEAAMHPIEELCLSSRVYVNLTGRYNRIRFIEDLLGKTKDDILHLTFIGNKAYDEIREKLILNGYPDPEDPNFIRKSDTGEADLPVEGRTLTIFLSEEELLGGFDEDEEEENLSALGKALSASLLRDRTHEEEHLDDETDVGLQSYESMNPPTDGN